MIDGFRTPCFLKIKKLLRHSQHLAPSLKRFDRSALLGVGVPPPSPGGGACSRGPRRPMLAQATLTRLVTSIDQVAWPAVQVQITRSGAALFWCAGMSGLAGPGCAANTGVLVSGSISQGHFRWTESRHLQTKSAWSNSARELPQGALHRVRQHLGLPDFRV